MPRTSTDSVLFTTYNLFDLGAGESAALGEHYRAVVEVIRALGTDVLAVQEIRGPGRATAGRWLQRLAGDTGLSCLVPGRGPAVPALATGSHGYHAGLLWRDGITPVPGSLRGRSHDLWHSLVWVLLDMGGVTVRHAAYHAPPFGRKIRADQNELVLASLGVTTAGCPPTLVGADWNGECADRVRDERTGAWHLYEPVDPFARVDWFGDLAYQCEWEYDEQGRRRHRADLAAGEVLWAGGLYDTAAALRAPWQPTTGHYPGDRYGTRGIRRRIDTVRVTGDVVPALRGHHVTDTGLTRGASDHLPVTVEYVPSAIARR